jgi:hypothetical protein
VPAPIVALDFGGAGAGDDAAADALNTSAWMR